MLSLAIESTDPELLGVFDAYGQQIRQRRVWRRGLGQHR
jgi:hypothetical protein